MVIFQMSADPAVTNKTQIAPTPSLKSQYLLPSEFPEMTASMKYY